MATTRSRKVCRSGRRGPSRVSLSDKGGEMGIRCGVCSLSPWCCIKWCTCFARSGRGRWCKHADYSDYSDYSYHSDHQIIVELEFGFAVAAAAATVRRVVTISVPGAVFPITQHVLHTYRTRRMVSQPPLDATQVVVMVTPSDLPDSRVGGEGLLTNAAQVYLVRGCAAGGFHRIPWFSLRNKRRIRNDLGDIV